MAVFNGSSLTLWVGGVAIAHSTSATLNLDADPIDVSSKDAGGFQNVISGQKSGSIDFEALVDFSSTGYGMEDLFDLWYNGTEISWSLGTGATASTAPYFDGIGIITSLSMDAPMEDVTTFSGTITITEAPDFTAS